MFASERQNKIREMLFQRKRLNVSSLAILFNVSEVTIRKDLNLLERDGILRKMYGGAVFNEDYLNVTQFTDNYSFSYRLEAPYLIEKKEIAATASNLISDGDIIYIGNGSTCACMADPILHNNELNNLTVVTNNVFVLNRLSTAENVNLVTSGGRMVKTNYSIGFFSGISNRSNNTLSELNYTKSFFTVDALSIEKGYMIMFPELISELNIIMENSKECYVIADSSKFDKVSMLQLAPFSRIKKIITDKEVPNSYKTFFFSNDIQIFLPVDMY